ncbi:MAG: type II toxin-antitoxin system RelE/ParE family toxin [Lewinellaceae bacterium]|nr:type II toxin-antitoxin system RelE/ParE family toxin [Saprospiraceae bacterium]MCB9340740.1 type II toxin-antitoxin system RelE/ParE family toxin [Lewinellaceae bacterium]
MKEYQVTWNPEAVEMLDKVFHFLSATQSDSEARKIKKDLIMLAYSLRTLPRRFPKERLLENSALEFRSAILGHFKLIFHPGVDQVIILGVFDTRQNPGKIKDFFS